MKNTRYKGYTIVEVMIVIAISSMMFAVISVTFSGKQQQVQFDQAVKDLDANIQDYMNDVSTGYFDNSGSVICDVNATPNSRPNLTTGGSSAQGTSDECVFVGKVLQFGSTGGSDSLNNLSVYTMLGRRNTSSGSIPTNLDQSKPVVIGPTASQPTLIDYVNQTQLSWGLRVKKVVIDNPDPLLDTEYGGIGFFTPFSSTSQGNTVSSLQTVRYGALSNTNLGMSIIDFTSQANNISDISGGGTNFVDTSGNLPIAICVESSDGNRTAAIVIGGQGNNNTRLEYGEYKDQLCNT